MGALSKVDEFLLDPQFQTCSVAVPGTTRNGDSGNREPNGDRSLDDPCPEVRFSSHHSGNLNSSEVEDDPHRALCCSINFYQTLLGLTSNKNVLSDRRLKLFCFCLVLIILISLGLCALDMTIKFRPVSSIDSADGIFGSKLEMFVDNCSFFV